ncbi:claspin -like [Asbolus verrucosus]|uniref:Claspin-like n=1 Tax=Asbolus verrucosus TaxID=1661398 RepID=A0A482VJ81_ASBVE|nr:claspin -like [Asbolus verrucosus]
MEEVRENAAELSEKENEMNLLNLNKTRKKHTIVDSDSDSELKETSEAGYNGKLALKSSSDGEEKNSNSENGSTQKKRVITALDSNSDEEITPHNKSFPDEEAAVEAIIYTSNNKGELVPENSSANPTKKSRLSGLYDSDTSEDEQIEENVIEDSIIKPVVYKPPRKRNKDDKPKRMTAQEAAKQRTEIQSESQRMLRESNVSLPYHKPKSYTLKEFLQKRTKLASALPLIPKAPPSVAIKMSKDTLEEVSKKLDERIKQVEEFYKSESEDEEESADIVSQEIRSWLDMLVDRAMDNVEDKLKREKTEETGNNEPESSEQQFSMDYEFNLDDVDENESARKPNISELLNEKLLNIRPKLSGEPDHIIDLEKGITKPSEVKKLVEKFFQHTAKKLPQKHKVQLNVVGVGSGGEIIKETVSMNVDEEEQPATVETPGAKLQKLRVELQNQMAQRRSELWKQRQEQGDCLATEKKMSDEQETEKDILDDDDEEEIEMTESESEDIDEDEENYNPPPEKPRTKSAFIDDEKPYIESNKSEFDFLTPVSFLTGLQNLNSDSKSNIEDLAEVICSGKFPQTQDYVSEDKASEDLVPTTQDLLNVCSGDFSSVPESSSNQTQDQGSEKVIINIQANPEQEIKSLDEDYSQIISQLLDEDELERFKKKFESPVPSATQRNYNLDEETEEVNATGLLNSDDENEGLEIKKRKRQKKLVFSDDEESDGGDEPDQEEDEERIDLHDTDDEEQILENEIKAQETGNYKPADFLDEEAELSESEWGSADEDEKGLDELEFEQGDEETFSENKVRSELERIHMRQILDEDNREVKLLQELLLEDGELHGTGRKRQFKWKALDSLDNSEFEKRDDDDIYLDEEESEEQWRKMRHKREMFLKKKSTTEDVDSILSDSQILKVGQQIFKSSQSFGSQNNTPVDKSELKEKEPFSLLSKRGSFLSRKDQVLQRLAEYTRVTDTTVGSTAKNSRCFVFQTFETAEAAVVKDNNNKRKAVDSTPNAIKKLRLDDLSPAISKKDGVKSGRAKKLFGNW